MAFTAVDAAKLIQEGKSDLFLKKQEEGSAVLRAATTTPMTSRQVGLPIASVLPEADFVPYGDDNRTKPTSTLSFGDKKLYAAEIAHIVPVREEDLEDATEDLVDYIVTQGAEAIARRLDASVLFGTTAGNAYPSEWDKSLYDSAVAAGNVFQIGTGVNDLYGSFAQAAGAVSDGGYEANAVLASSGLRWELHNLRDSNGAAVYAGALGESVDSDATVAGLDAYFARKVWDPTKAKMLVIDPSAVVIGVRKDITVKILTEATVGGVNLAETDQIGFRFVARYGFALADPKAVAAVTSAPAAG